MESENKNITDKLLNGETVFCVKCHKGKYISKAKDISKSHDFYCDNCGDNIHLIPNITVE